MVFSAKKIVEKMIIIFRRYYYSWPDITFLLNHCIKTNILWYNWLQDKLHSTWNTTFAYIHPCTLVLTVGETKQTKIARSLELLCLHALTFSPTPPMGERACNQGEYEEKYVAIVPGAWPLCPKIALHGYCTYYKRLIGAYEGTLHFLRTIMIIL